MIGLIPRLGSMCPIAPAALSGAAYDWCSLPTESLRRHAGASIPLHRELRVSVRTISRIHSLPGTAPTRP
jgi:hypothetical protein